jgi:hypothetical protein
MIGVVKTLCEIDCHQGCEETIYDASVERDVKVMEPRVDMMLQMLE